MALAIHPLRAGGATAAGRNADGSVCRAPQTVTDAEEPARPIDVQVWNWAESAVLGGYGPSTSGFL
ncbi:hypothetical protein ACWD7Y_22585 [Streptomyces drozdowiczii]